MEITLAVVLGALAEVAGRAREKEREAELRAKKLEATQHVYWLKERTYWSGVIDGAEAMADALKALGEGDS